MFPYLGIGINLLLVLLLASKKGKSPADKILLVWLILLCSHLSLYAFSLQPITVNNIHWFFGTSIPFPLLHGPMLYLYTAAMTNLLPSNRKFLFLHFMPALIVVLSFAPLYFKTADEKIAFLSSNAKGYETANLVRIISLQVSGFVYVIWSLWLLGKHKSNISQEFSYKEKINLNWLRYFIYGLAAIWIIIVVTKSNYYIFGGAVLFIIFLGYFGIKQVGIFTPANRYNPDDAVRAEEPIKNTTEKEVSQYNFSETETENAIELTTEQLKIPDTSPVFKKNDFIKEIQSKRYKNPGLPENVANEIHQRLNYLMSQEKIFTEPDLSLSMLAEKLKVHPNFLSQVINQKEGKSFFDYINTLRIEEFKKRLNSPDSRQFTMMSIAYDCGFNSKTAFYRNFKNFTGQSPTDYLKDQNDAINLS